jgi:hypothetical protein
VSAGQTAGMADEEQTDEPDDADPGWIGGGGPASTIEGDEPTDEERHLEDTDHSVAD